jgi:hypothetical protein
VALDDNLLVLSRDGGQGNASPNPSVVKSILSSTSVGSLTDFAGDAARNGAGGMITSRRRAGFSIRPLSASKPSTY